MVAFTGYGRVFRKPSHGPGLVSTGLVKAGINPNEALTAGFAAGATGSLLGAVNVSLRISTGERTAAAGLGMNGARAPHPSTSVPARSPRPAPL